MTNSIETAKAIGTGVARATFQAVAPRTTAQLNATRRLVEEMNPDEKEAERQRKEREAINALFGRKISV